MLCGYLDSVASMEQIDEVYEKNLSLLEARSLQF